MASIRVDRVRQVFNDGNHNAFTDLCRYNGRFYLAFRSCPDGHMLFTSSQILVLSSEDSNRWEEVCRFSVPNRDVRDPHFLVFDGKLFVVSGTWWVDPSDSSERDINDHLGYCVWSEDGQQWHGPRALDGTHGYYIWRAGAHNGMAYLNGRRVKDFAVIEDRVKRDEQMESWLMCSADGFYWKPLGLMQPTQGDETAFLFEEDGSVLAVARSMGRRAAQVCRSHPPYTEWTRSDLDRYVGGPMLAKWGDRYLVGGRKMIGDAKPTTALYWLVEDQLVEVAELPSGGDNSYPGFVQLSEDRGLLSFYSSHEGSGTSLAPSAIYLAELSLDPA
ncbi:MAG: hypothetical protein KF893_17460 [Caldilineaceae bacterium]|nr:hypothetical protein [Caldilineaceae bacterium]